MRDLWVDIRYLIYEYSYYLQYIILLVIFHYSITYLMDYLDVAQFQRGVDNPWTTFVFPMIGLLAATLFLWFIIRQWSKNTVDYGNEGFNGILMFFTNIGYLIYAGTSYECGNELAFIFLTSVTLAITCQVAYGINLSGD